MVGPADIIYGVLLPALIAGVLLLLGGRGTSLAGKPRPFIGALAIGAGYLVCHVTRVGMPPVPFGSTQVPARDWIAWIVLAAIVLAPIRLVPALQRWSGPLYLALFSVLVIRFVLGNALGADLTSMMERLGLTFVLYVVWNLLERLSALSTGPALPVGLIAAGSGVALCAFFTSSELLAQQCGAVCAGLGAAAVMGLIDRDFRLPVGAIAVALIVCAGALVICAIYGLSPIAVVLLVVAFVATWVSQMGRMSSLTPIRRAIVALAAAGVPAGIAVLIAHAANAAADAAQ
jgi:hypothetical protein